MLMSNPALFKYVWAVKQALKLYEITKNYHAKMDFANVMWEFLLSKSDCMRGKSRPWDSKTVAVGRVRGVAVGEG